MGGLGGFTYAAAGVRYADLDPFKQEAQQVARLTAPWLHRWGFQEVVGTRGESAYLIETPDAYLAHVIEGLGTKNLVADAMGALAGASYYDRIAQDTVAMVVNDLATVGALPLAVNMHLAVGDSEWFTRDNRSVQLIHGWKQACDLARCTWSGGETPTLKGIIQPGTVELSGSAIGIVKPKDRLIRGDISSGDAIVFVASSGIHANGLTLARHIAERRDPWWRKALHLLLPRYIKLQGLPLGYYTNVGNDQPYGEALLEPTLIYTPLVEAILAAGISIHYAINITGHGWRKLMRHPEPFVYHVSWISAPPPIFRFIQEHGGVEMREMYATFNMGVGFALIVSHADMDRICAIAKELGFSAWRAGQVKQEGGRKAVRIEELRIEYEETELTIR